MGSLSILNNIPALEAQNQLGITQNNLNQTLTALSSGMRINTGADDPAGLAIANGLEANVTALTQSVQNATDGVGELQVADGALSQITSLLNSAVSLATESANGTVSDQQRTALQAEFQSIQNRNQQHRRQHHLQRSGDLQWRHDRYLHERFFQRRR